MSSRKKAAKSAGKGASILRGVSTPTPPAPTDDESDRERIAHLEAEFAKAERLTFFSDAVVAIAVTLLALDLPVPESGDSREILHFASAHLDQYLAFLISFLVIGSHWFRHHQVFGYLKALGGWVARLNMIWLLVIILTPFATRVIYGDGAFPLRFGFYAAVMALQTIIFTLMVWEMDRNVLARNGTPRAMFARSYRAGVTMTVAFAGSIPLAVFFGHWAFVCWVAVPWAAHAFRSLRGRFARRARA